MKHRAGGPQVATQGSSIPNVRDLRMNVAAELLLKPAQVPVDTPPRQIVIDNHRFAVIEQARGELMPDSATRS